MSPPPMEQKNRAFLADYDPALVRAWDRLEGTPLTPPPARKGGETLSLQGQWVHSRYAPAKEIAQVLTTFVSASGTFPGRRGGPELPPGTTIVPDARTQSLLVETGDADLTEKIEALVRVLDVPVGVTTSEVKEG